MTMSASREKKARQELNESGYVDPRKAREAEEKAKSSGEIDELNGQIVVMQEVIDSKESEVASLKKVTVLVVIHA